MTDKRLHRTHQPYRRVGFDGMAYARRLNAVLVERGISGFAMSVEIGVDPATVSRLRRHGLWPDVAGLLAISNWAGLNPLEFFIDRERAQLEDDELRATYGAGRW